MAERPTDRTNEEFEVTEMEESRLDEATGAREPDLVCGGCNMICGCPENLFC